jgi:hypothetical protein
MEKGGEDKRKFGTAYHPSKFGMEAGERRRWVKDVKAMEDVVMEAGR